MNQFGFRKTAPFRKSVSIASIFAMLAVFAVPAGICASECALQGLHAVQGLHTAKGLHKEAIPKEAPNEAHIGSDCHTAQAQPTPSSEDCSHMGRCYLLGELEGEGGQLLTGDISPAIIFTAVRPQTPVEPIVLVQPLEPAILALPSQRRYLLHSTFLL